MEFTFGPRVRRTPFHDATVNEGMAHFSVYNKMILPISYGDLDAEYDRLIHGVTIWDVSAQRQVEISGPDSDRLAQYLTARDLSGMQQGQGKYVAMCDHSGRLLNDPILMKLSGGRYWFSLADHDMLLWCRAIAAEGGFDATVSEPDVSPLAVQGPRAGNLIADLFGAWTKDLRSFWFKETDLGGIPLVLSRSGWSKQGGFELFLQDGSRGVDLYRQITTAGAKYGIGPGAPNHLERVESALLSFGGDTTADSNPFEAGMARYVDVDLDADYIGKESLRQVVASGPRRLFTGLMVDGTSPAAWPLPEAVPVYHAGRAVGTMSAIVHSRRLGRTIALAQVERPIVDAEARVDIQSPDGMVQATIHSLPFL